MQKNLSCFLIRALAFFAMAAAGQASATEYTYRTFTPGLRAPIAPALPPPATPVLSAAVLQAPYTALVYEGKHPVWLETGHAWTWHSTAYTFIAAVGSFSFEALLSNSTLANRAVVLRFSADNTVDGITLNGSVQPLSPCASYGYASLCEMSLTLVPGTSVVTISINNAGADANPAGFSAWVTDVGSGAILADSTVSPGVSQWYKY